MKILFVCLGNICRSPMAEAVMRHKLEKDGLTEWVVDSAGTAGYHQGETPHSGTCAKLREKGISYERIRARKLLKSDFSEFDYIIAMDEDNLRDIHTQAKAAGRKKTAKISLLADFLEGGCWDIGRSVPDPWYTGSFDETFRLIDEGCEALKEVLYEDNGIVLSARVSRRCEHRLV